MAEQFAFKQLGRDGGAIDTDKILVTAIRQLMEFARDYLFAATGLALNQNGGVRSGAEEIIWVSWIASSLQPMMPLRLWLLGWSVRDLLL